MRNSLSSDPWARNAAALLLFVSKTTFDFNGQPSITHSFDTGAAWENLALQGWLKGYVVHGMQGFDSQSFPLRTAKKFVIGEVGERHTVRPSTSIILLNMNRVNMAVCMVVARISRPNVSMLVAIQRNAEFVLLYQPIRLL